jgi:hypothetical protein
MAVSTVVHLYNHVIEEDTRAVMCTLPPDHTIARLFDAFSVGAGGTNLLAFYPTFEKNPSLSQSAFNMSAGNFIQKVNWDKLENRYRSPLSADTCGVATEMKDAIVTFVDTYVELHGGEGIASPHLLQQLRSISCYTTTSGIKEVLQMHLMACVLHSFTHTLLDHMFTSPFFQPKFSHLPDDLNMIKTENDLLQTLVLYPNHRVSVGNSLEFYANLKTYLYLPLERDLVTSFTSNVRSIQGKALSDPSMYVMPVYDNTFLLPGFVR